MEQGRIRIQSLLEQAIGKGQIPRVKKPELLSKKIQCLIVGSVVLAFTGGKEGNVNEYRHITSQMLSDLLQSHINRKVE